MFYNFQIKERVAHITDYSVLETYIKGYDKDGNFITDVGKFDRAGKQIDCPDCGTSKIAKINKKYASIIFRNTALKRIENFDFRKLDDSTLKKIVEYMENKLFWKNR